MLLLELLHMGAGDQQALPAVHDSLVPLYGTEMSHVDNVGQMDMYEYPAVELFPYRACCLVCPVIFLGCVDNCLASLLFNVQNVVTAYPELVFPEMKDKIPFYHL